MVAQSLDSDDEITFTLPLMPLLMVLGAVTLAALLIAGCVITALACYCKSRRRSR